MTRMPLRSLLAVAVCSSVSMGAHAAATYNLNVEIIQVNADNGTNPTALEPAGGSANAYVYESQVNDIWAQAGIQVTFSYSTWNNTEAQRLTSTERNAIYNDTYTSGTGDVLPGVGVDRVQVFFVMDHSGTGYDGTAGSGWVGNPLADPMFSARNAGNAQLGISGFISNGRAVMANEGFASDSLSGTIAHEIGHLLGLRHVGDVNGGAGNGTTADPDYTVGAGDANLMWEAGSGPDYNGGQSLAQNFDLNDEQIAAAIFNGLDLDPDGNGTGVLQVIPEPSSLALLGLGAAMTMRRRRAA